MNRTWRAMMCAMVLGAALPLFANAANLSMEPQPLGSALQDLAKQSDVQIIFFSKAVEGRRAPALNGTYTPEEAVALLLEGSGLTYYVLNERTIEVAAKPEVTARPVTPAPSPVIPVLAAPLDEVEVIAPREELNAMREEIQSLEERFYAQYNKLNTSAQYDIVCTTEKPPVVSTSARHASRLPGSGRGAQRICEPAFVKDAVREATAARANDPCAPPARLIVLTKMAGYQEEMINVVEKHPELGALMKEHQELAQRYEASRKGSVRGAAPKAGVKSGISSSRESAAALIATLGRCLSKERSWSSLRTEEWALAKGLEPIETDGKLYFCLRQPGVAQPIRNSLTCASLVDLRQARFGAPPSSSSGLDGFDDPIQPNPPNQGISFAEQAALKGLPVYP